MFLISPPPVHLAAVPSEGVGAGGSSQFKPYISRSAPPTEPALDPPEWSLGQMISQEGKDSFIFKLFYTKLQENISDVWIYIFYLGENFKFHLKIILIR